MKLIWGVVLTAASAANLFADVSFDLYFGNASLINSNYIALEPAVVGSQFALPIALSIDQMQGSHRFYNLQLQFSYDPTFLQFSGLDLTPLSGYPDLSYDPLFTSAMILQPGEIVAHYHFTDGAIDLLVGDLGNLVFSAIAPGTSTVVPTSESGLLAGGDTAVNFFSPTTVAATCPSTGCASDATGGSINFNQPTVPDPTATPEPASGILASAGLWGVWLFRKRWLRRSNVARVS